MSCNLFIDMSIKMMNYLFFVKTLILFFAFTYISPTNSKELEKFNDWSAYAEGEREKPSLYGCF